MVNNLDAHTVQKLATRAFRAAERILYGKAKKVRFKGKDQFDSLESKSNDAGIRWRNSKVEWNGLSLASLIDSEDKVITHGLKHKVKYCRVVRRIIRNKNRFYVQLIMEGKSLIKERNHMGKGKVFFDIGPSTIAIVSHNNEESNQFQARLTQFCSELDTKQKTIAQFQRKIERQRRQNNPNNYSENGKITKGGHKWKRSKRQLKNASELREVYRKVSCYRKSLHGKLSNEIIRMGNDFGTEKISMKWFQKLFGKSVGIRAPGMLVSGVKRKAERAGGLFQEMNTNATKLSQICICERQKKKTLSNRVHDCECGVHAQRDLFSAYLGLFYEKIEKIEKTEKVGVISEKGKISKVSKTSKKNEKVYEYIFHADQAQSAWSSADKLLQAAWEKSVQFVSGKATPSSFGKPSSLKTLVFLSQNGSSAEEGQNIIAKFKIQDVVLNCPRIRESLKENKVFPLEPAGF